MAELLFQTNPPDRLISCFMESPELSRVFHADKCRPVKLFGDGNKDRVAFGAVATDRRCGSSFRDSFSYRTETGLFENRVYNGHEKGAH